MLLQDNQLKMTEFGIHPRHDDLSKLGVLDECVILDELRSRFHNGEYYVSRPSVDIHNPGTSHLV